MKKYMLMGIGSVIFGACAPYHDKAPADTPAMLESGPQLVRIAPTPGNKVTGDLRLVRQGNEILVTGRIEGLVPGQDHGIHIHEKGDCSGPNADGAGPHFNPMDQLHGDVHAPMRHAGDMGNLKADNAGVAAVNIRVPMPMEASLIGRAVVVHAQPDDLKSQPAGNSGARVGCGMITPAM